MADADVVVTHAYEGGHPDHDAAAFAVQAAAQRTGVPVLEMAGYHGATGSLSVGRFLPPPGEAAPETVLRLTPEQQALKRRMLGCFVSQAQVLAAFPTGEERLRPAPRYDFTTPPHSGRLLYETMPWGITGAGFRALAAEARRAIAAWA
jgi:LmbE family N-acetylglucosaminyl deacetylase